MYYEINVSLNGRHFFATSERSITDMPKLKAVYAVLMSKFPKSEGYEFIVTRWEKQGHNLKDEQILSKDFLKHFNQ